MSQYTPMIEQYLEIKEQHQDAILFFRLGDFYEMFFQDAETASRELEIVLTARDGGQDERIPMCGIPYHAADSYIARLVAQGYKVAICEQVEDPKKARGIVKREVVRIITPGTITDENLLQEDRNNYLAAVVESKNCAGLAWVDVSTGEFQVAEFTGSAGLAALSVELQRIAPAECLIDNLGNLYSQYWTNPAWPLRAAAAGIPEPALDLNRAQNILLNHFKTATLDGFGLRGFSAGIMAAAAITLFLQDTHQQHLENILGLKVHRPENFLGIDAASRRNLEITGNLRDGGKQNTLLSILDLCHTGMGKRLLRKWLELPLREVSAINQRLDGVEELFSNIELREQLAAVLKRIYDMERLGGKLGSGLANPRDLLALKSSCQALNDLTELLQGCQTEIIRHAGSMDNLQDIANLIDQAIMDEAPITVKEGGLIKPGFDQEIDELKRLASEGSAWLVDYENKEKERTGIKHLKVGFNKVFGYYLEISRSNLHLVPADYVRKQTLVNTERFITDALKQYEDRILGARERLFALEYEAFVRLRNTLAEHLQRIQDSASKVALVDVLLALAECAFRNDYVRPLVDESGRIEIKAGRHPVVEQNLPGGHFVPNDVRMDSDSCRFMLITGPNMGGKSTYMRQTALIVILAQMGCFVPAREARIGVVDQIFTRVGASDDLASGQSTFMVEMVEVANILHNASPKSLVILDEIGRGTSTFDGLSIARAVCEDLANRIKARTLFATHYHELTSLAEDTPGIVNLSVSVKESGDTVVFLKKVLPGKADKSYGIHVAGLAGVPETVLQRAKEVLKQLENRPPKASASLVFEQPALFASENALLTELQRLDVDSLSPREALNILYRWKSDFA